MLDLVPDRDGEHHACDEEDDEHDPEPNPGALRALAVRDARLPASAVQTHGLLDLLVVDDGHVLRFQLTQRLRHAVKCKGRTPVGAMLHTMQPMAFHDRDIPGESLFERGIIGIGDRLGLLAGVVLAVSAFTGWYSGPGEGVKVSVMGWDTGVAGKVVFFLGIAVVVVIALREVGVQMPATVPESLLTIALGAAATIIVLIRTISKPDDFFFAGRGVGIWISLIAAIAVIVAGLLQASEEL